jgi:hypothetical protein
MSKIGNEARLIQSLAHERMEKEVTRVERLTTVTEDYKRGFRRATEAYVLELATISHELENK